MLTTSILFVLVLVAFAVVGYVLRDKVVEAAASQRTKSKLFGVVLLANLAAIVGLVVAYLGMVAHAPWATLTAGLMLSLMTLCGGYIVAGISNVRIFR